VSRVFSRTVQITYSLFVVFRRTVFDGAEQGEEERKKERREKRDTMDLPPVCGHILVIE